MQARPVPDCGGDDIGLVRKKDFSGRTDQECDELAFERVVRSVSACEQSTAKMRRKLEEAGYPQRSIDHAIEKAVRIGAIDDMRYCECLVRGTLASGKGLRFALKEIEALGVDPYELDAYCEYLDEEDGAEVERALDFLARHPSRSKDQRGAAYRKLMSKGFPSDVASTASRLFVEAER